MKRLLIISIIFSCAIVFSQSESRVVTPPYWGTIFVDPDIITEDDVTTFIEAPYAGQGMRTMFDRRVNGWITVNAYLFNATFDDSLTSEIQVNPEFGSSDTAFVYAERYGIAIGRLPTVLRGDVETVWIHQGTQPFGGGNNNLLIHTGQALDYIDDGILEEALIHEAAHTSLDSDHASSAGWLSAQTMDGEFISTYAQDNPTQEDIAESFLLYLAIRYRSDRITQSTYQTITQTIPNRIQYFDNQSFNMYPISPVWHVATTGSDQTGDGSVYNPFATIQAGIGAASNGDTVLVAAGTYVENINFNGKSIVVIGEDTETTIIDGNQSGKVAMFENGEDSTTVLSGFTLQNGFASGGPSTNSGGGVYCSQAQPTLKHLIIISNSALHGGGIYLDRSNLKMINIMITNNSVAGSGGGIFSDESQIVMDSVLIINNSAETHGGGIFCHRMSYLSMSNVTLSSNTAGVEGGAINSQESSYSLLNSILWDNSPSEISFRAEGAYNDTISVSNSDIKGGETGINISGSYGIVNWQESNIDANPYFCNPDSGDYTLAENSPCVGAGENGANMGAFGVGCSSYNFSPTDFSLAQPSNNDQITIDESNMNTGSITFSWGASSDQNGDSLYYLMRATSAEIGDHGMDTNATSFDLSYMDIIEDMSDNNVTAASLEWSVHVTDGIDTVEADNAPFSITIDGANALNSYLEGLIPDEFAIHQNYPNPFNPVTTLRYDLPENGLVNITIYDMLGRQVKTLINQTQDAGYRSVIWDATNDYGKPVSAGIYLYQIQAGEYISTKKMVLLK